MDINQKTKEWQESCNQARLRCGWIECQKRRIRNPGMGMTPLYYYDRKRQDNYYFYHSSY